VDHYFNLKNSLIVAAVLLLPLTQAETIGTAD
jgi:hypothetical protein